MGDQPHSELSVTACLISLFINSQNICIINNLIIILIVRVIFQKLVPKQIEIAQFLIKLHQDIIRYNDINCHFIVWINAESLDKENWREGGFW